jgi:hypothetical protein
MKFHQIFSEIICEKFSDVRAGPLGGNRGSVLIPDSEGGPVFPGDRLGRRVLNPEKEITKGIRAEQIQTATTH